MKRILLATAAALALSTAGAAHAQEVQPKTAGTLMINARVTDVAPDAGDDILTAVGAPTGLKADISDGWAPTLGIAYFLTDKVAVDVTLGTTHHTVRAKGPGTNVKVHETWVLPPVVTLQYHPMPDAKVSPYVGAGVNYMLFYSGKDKNGFTVDVDNGFGWALQAGADVALTGPYSVNVDVKKVFFKTDASINNGALKSKVNLDPWVVSAGIGYKF